MSDKGAGKILWGLLVCWGLNLLEIFLPFFWIGPSDRVISVAIGGIGLIQLIYVLPLYFLFKQKGKTDTAKGIVIAASITAFLNASCWGIFWPH